MASESASNRTGFEQFRDEFSRSWRDLPYKGLFLGLLAAWLVLFVFLGNSTLGYTNRPSLIGWLDWVVAQNDDQHGPWILVVVLALLWWKRKELREAPKRNWWPALAIVLGGVLIHALGYMVQQTRISLFGFFVGIYGLVGVVWGPQMLRATFFPMFLFGFCMPLGGTVGNYMTLPLRIMATKITQVICDWILGIHVIQNGTQIYDANGAYSYDVAAACSGIRSLTATLALAVIYGFVMFKSMWRRAAMIAATIPLAIAANVVRLTSIIIASEAFGQSSGKYVHESWWTSLMPYIPMIGGVLLLGHWLRETRPTNASSESAPSWSTRELATILGALIGLFIVRDQWPVVKEWTYQHQYTSVWIGVALLIGILAFVANRADDATYTTDRSHNRWSIATTTLALLLMAGTAFGLQYRQGHQRLGQPGVKVVQAQLYDPDGKLAATNTIALPERVLNYESEVIPLERVVLEWLPKDTTYGQRRYVHDRFGVQMTAVLMGTDRTSIHQPQYCLTGNGWQIDQTETDNIDIQQPHSYALPVNKLIVGRTERTKDGTEVRVSGVFVYWFVAENSLTAEHGKRMLDMGLEMLRTGVLQRWAYVSCFSICLPGQEDDTYKRIKELITAAVPQFQLTTGQPASLASNP